MPVFYTGIKNLIIKTYIMKKFIKNTIILFLLLAVAEVDAQQNVVSTHYTVNPYLYNAAQVGESGYTTLSAHYRRQWVNMPEAPDTKLFSAQTMIKDKFGIGAKVYLDEYNNTAKALPLINEEIVNRPTPQSYDLLAWYYFKKKKLKNR